MTHGYVIRRTRPGEWRRLRELRLAALSDPVSGVAFGDTYENAAARPAVYWQQQCVADADRRGNATFVAVPGGEGEDAPWAGMLTVRRSDGDAAHIYGVYLRAAHRGAGLGDRVFAATADWVWQHTDTERLRLHVHESNARARAFYLRLGFAPTGEWEAHPKPPYGRAYILEMPRPRPGHTAPGGDGGGARDSAPPPDRP